MIYFFDTSAVVKRYHHERGTDVVDFAFKDHNVAKVISDISVIEIYSAFSKKVRTSEISQAVFHQTVAALAQDIRSGAIELTALTESDKKEAVMLIGKYGLSRNLRTLDALQLAVVNRLALGNPIRVYCADGALVGIIEAEGITVIDPESPP